MLFIVSSMAGHKNIQYVLIFCLTSGQASGHTFVSILNWYTVVACCYGAARMFCQKFCSLKSWPTWGTQASHRCWERVAGGRVSVHTLRPGANTALLPNTVHMASHSTLSNLSASNSTAIWQTHGHTALQSPQFWGRTVCGGCPPSTATCSLSQDASPKLWPGPGYKPLLRYCCPIRNMHRTRRHAYMDLTRFRLNAHLTRYNTLT